MDGILLVNKPQGYTSHDVVNKLRRILKTKKIGHTGTLDPNVTGLLVILVGKATKALPYLENSDKEYVCKFELGYQSDTEDIWGETNAQADINLDYDLAATLKEFEGEQLQLPPMISSIKVNGKKLYEYARANQEVERPLRKVTFYELEAYDNQSFRVKCSSGTYIRSLVRDLGPKINNLAILSSLERTMVGNYKLDDAFTLEEIEAGNFKLESLESALGYLPKIVFKDATRIYHGKEINNTMDYPFAAVYDNDKVIAIYQQKEPGVYKMSRGLW